MSRETHRAGDGMAQEVMSRFGVSCPIPGSPLLEQGKGLISLLVTVEVSQELYQSSLCEVPTGEVLQAPLLAMPFGSSSSLFPKPQGLFGFRSSGCEHMLGWLLEQHEATGTCQPHESSVGTDISVMPGYCARLCHQAFAR